MENRLRTRPEHWRHLARMLRQGSRPVPAIYESIGDGYPLAPAPGWLNLGLWEGPGDEEEAAVAPRRLVEVLAAPLPREGDILDVANGLGLQDEVIAERLRPRRLVALNLTESQLGAGRTRLVRAGALPVAADAVCLPVADGSMDGVISVEAAFHFPSREAFFSEVVRVLRPGGVLSMSDITAERRPRGPAEWLAGLSLLRFWGLRRDTLASRAEVVTQAQEAGLVDVEAEAVGARVFEPVLDLVAARLRETRELPLPVRMAGRTLLAQWRLLWRRGLMEYVLLRARAPISLAHPDHRPGGSP